MFDIKDVKDPMHPGAVCCLLVINCFPFFKLKKKRIAIIVATVSVWPSARQDYAEFMSGLVWGVGNWVSCSGAKCNTAQNQLRTPTHANLVPPILSGIFRFTRLIWATSPLWKRTKRYCKWEDKLLDSGHVSSPSRLLLMENPLSCYDQKKFPHERAFFYPQAAAVWEGLGSP